VTAAVGSPPGDPSIAMADADLVGLGAVDVVVAVSTYNSAATVGPVAETIRAGLAKHFAGVRALLVQTDAGSTDDADALAGVDGLAVLRLAHGASPAERAVPPFHGLPGRREAQRLALEVARQVEARACVFVGPASVTATPEWIDRLLRPVLEADVDYVAPAYLRHRYDGTLTRGLIAPLIRALFRIAIRHPFGTEAALSGRFLRELLDRPIWDGEASRQGIDLWLPATAALGRFAVCEAWLGPGPAGAGPRGVDLASTFSQAVGAAFALMEATADTWPALTAGAPVGTTGVPLPLATEPRALDTGHMIRAFQLGLRDLLPLWTQVLDPATAAELLPLGSVPDEAFRFPHDLWARVVYDFALGYRFRVLHREHLLRALVPLYLGRTAAFVGGTRTGRALASETWLEAGARAFEHERPYLLERWG
jgi:hypothetical protein